MKPRARVVRPIDGRPLVWSWLIGWFVVGALSAVAWGTFGLYFFASRFGGARGFLVWLPVMMLVLSGLVAFLFVRPIRAHVWIAQGAVRLSIVPCVGVLAGWIWARALLFNDYIAAAFPLISWPSGPLFILSLISLVFLVIILGIGVLLGGLFFRFGSGHRVRQSGQMCWVCAYNLAGLRTEEAVCPECGWAIGKMPDLPWRVRMLTGATSRTWRTAAIVVALVCAAVLWFARVQPVLEFQLGAGRGHVCRTTITGSVAVWMRDEKMIGRGFSIEYRPWFLLPGLRVFPSMTTVSVSSPPPATDFWLPGDGSKRIAAVVEAPHLQRRVRTEGPPESILAELRSRADAVDWVPSPPNAAQTPAAPSDFFTADPFLQAGDGK